MTRKRPFLLTNLNAVGLKVTLAQPVVKTQ
jgi:hypothetical protein